MERKEIADKFEGLVRGFRPEMHGVINLFENPNAQYLLVFNNPNFPYNNQLGVGLHYDDKSKRLILRPFGVVEKSVPKNLIDYLSANFPESSFRTTGNVAVWDNVSF